MTLPLISATLPAEPLPGELWGALGDLWDPLGELWGPLGSIWERMGSIWEPLEVTWVPFWHQWDVIRPFLVEKKRPLRACAEGNPVF